MNTNGTRQLCDTADRQFHFLACSHDQITELINDDDDIRHEMVSLFRIELAVDELGVIFLHITTTCLLQQVVTGIHFHAKGVQSLNHLRYIGNDGIFSVRKLRQEVSFNRSINREFHLLRVYDDELEFCRMLLI